MRSGELHASSRLPFTRMFCNISVARNDSDSGRVYGARALNLPSIGG